MRMPSWVPNWADKDTANHFGYLPRACGNSKAVARHQGDGVLSAAGVIFATVSSVQEMTFQRSCKGQPTYKGTVDMIKRLTPQKTKHLSYIAGGSLVDAFWRTLACNRFRNEFHPPNANYANFEEAFILDKNRLFDVPSDTRKFLNSVGTLCGKRSFITTEEGYIGIAPKATKPGDHACVLFGSQMPLLLRKSSGLQSQVVGECYIHGLMDGEAFLGPLPDRFASVNLWNIGRSAYDYAFVDKETGKTQYKDPRIEVNEQMVKKGNTFIQPDGSVSVELKPNLLKQRGVNVQTFNLI